MSKKIAILMSLLVIFCVVFFIQNKNTALPAKKTEEISLRVTQIVLIKSKKSVSTSSFKKGETALELLSSSHTVTAKGQKGNAFVTAIDGEIANSEKEFWSFYVNGTQAQVGAGSYILKNNDTIEWKIEAFK